MRLFIQSYHTGKLILAEVSLPTMERGNVLEQTDVSAISLGTEGKKVAARGIIQVRYIGKNRFCER